MTGPSQGYSVVVHPPSCSCLGSTTINDKCTLRNNLDVKIGQSLPTLTTALANCGRQYLHTCRSYSIRPFRRPFSPYLTNFLPHPPSFHRSPHPTNPGTVSPSLHPLPSVGRATAALWRRTDLLSPAPTPQACNPAENSSLHRSKLPISGTLYFLCPDTCLKRSACHRSLCMQ
jgi:hypothetical protein